MAKAFFITSGRWLRIAPEESSTPLQTMSYWIALKPRILSWSAGSSARNSSTAMFGMENGLCEKSIFFSSSFHSYMGKSTIQQSSKLILSNKVELLTQACPHRTSNSACLGSFSGGEEEDIA